MSNIQQLKRDARLERWAGPPPIDAVSKTLANIREADADEAAEKARKAYALMYSTSEQLADIVRELRDLGHLNTREQRVMSILNDAILALEAEGITQ